MCCLSSDCGCQFPWLSSSRWHYWWSSCWLHGSVLNGLGHGDAHGEIVSVGVAWSAGGMFFELEQCVVEHANDDPVAGAALVEACGVDRCVEAAAYAVAHALSAG